jgi:hypothetical protein
MTKIKQEIHRLDSAADSVGDTCEFEFVPSIKRPKSIYIRLNGRRIAQRARDGSGTWVPLIPGYNVVDETSGSLSIYFVGKRVH